MHKLSKVKMLTDALSECVSDKSCVGMFSYIDDAWKWEYYPEKDEFSVNLQFFPEALDEMLLHHYTGYGFVDGYPNGSMEVRLAVFKLIKPLPRLEEF